MAQLNFPPLLHLTYILQHLSDENLLTSGGAGLSQTRLMSVLNGSVSTSQNHMAMQLHQTEANVSRQLQVMKKHGLVSITKNKKDGRQRDVKLTAKGTKKYQTALKVLNKQEANLLKLIDKKDLKSFDHAINNLLKASNQ